MQLNLFEHNTIDSDAQGKLNDDKEDNNTEIFKINELDCELENVFRDKISIAYDLSRKIVSFQGNKSKAKYRLFKYKEAFSPELVDYCLQIQNRLNVKKVLDPFAGVGTTLFACSHLGIKSDGIELLPVGQEIIQAHQLLNSFNDDDFSRLLFWQNSLPWRQSTHRKALNQLPITQGAYPLENQTSIEKYLYILDSENYKVKKVLFFALVAILESISYTRKDGQYLRWDKRANRKNTSKKFCKGKILEFDTEITKQIKAILSDFLEGQQNIFSSQEPSYKEDSIKLIAGSCLKILPTLGNETYDTVITSPPYCNRYDYTRTYALELALLGITHEDIKRLRQEMLSCTVENKNKNIINNWDDAITVADEEKLLQQILSFLESESKKNNLNNKGIPRMIKGYFYEMSCVISECFRVLRPGGYMFVVNDNVRYAGVNISVDLILSGIAEKLGFIVEKILVLPTKKGNSSQQMGIHGRKPLRKCVYVWQKPL